MRQNLQKNECLPALRAWMHFIGAGELLDDTIPTSLEWLRIRWESGDEHLPFWLVHDLGYLLLQGSSFRFASAKFLEKWPEEERSIRLAYEDKILGRWALDPSVLSIHIEIAGMTPEQRTPAIAHAIGLALSKPLASLNELPYGNTAYLRGLSSTRLLQAFLEETDPEWIAWAKAQVKACIETLSTKRLYGEEDIWEIAHHPALPNESARIALREIHTAAAKIGKVSPTVALSIERKAKEVPVDIETSDAYPTGGFNEISTRGIFENIVRTEVVYVGEGTSEDNSIDLFDMRFVEGELLYYTRDESPLLDAKREINFVFDRPLELRYKLPNLPSQTLVLIQALALVLQSDLIRIFGPAGSFLRLIWRTDSEEAQIVASEESTLMSIALQSEIAHQRVELSQSSLWENIPKAGRMIFSPRPKPPTFKCLAWIRVGGEEWIIKDKTFSIAKGYPSLRKLLDHLLIF